MRPFIFFLTLLIMLPLGIALPKADVAKANGFDAGTIVSDSFFTARDAMSLGDIQTFLAQKGSVLASIGSDQLGDGANGRSAAQIIYDASRTNRTDFASSQGYGPSNPLVMTLNPQVLLITLQKENSLITGTYIAGSTSTSSALRSAMGYGCPDSGGCDAAYAGFTNQVVYAAAQFMKNYYKAATSSYQPGQTYTIANTTGPPYNAPATQSVTIGNATSSSLYQYTPHVYNGNYNFWYYSNLWFAGPINGFSPTARIIKRQNSAEVYVARADLSKKWYMSSFSDARAWGIGATTETLPDNQVTAIPTGKGKISRLQKGSSTNVYYIENAHRHHIGDERQFPIWGLNWSELSETDDEIMNQLVDGPPIGLLSKSPSRFEVYFITMNRKYYIPSEAALTNWGFTWADVNVIPQATLDSYPNGGDLSLVAQFEGRPEVYIITNGQRRYIRTEAILKDWNLNFGMLTNIGQEKLLSTPEAKELSRVAKGSGPNVYFIENGQKRYLSSWSKLGAKGASQDDLMTVSDYFLNRLPTGPSL